MCLGGILSLSHFLVTYIHLKNLVTYASSVIYIRLGGILSLIAGKIPWRYVILDLLEAMLISRSFHCCSLLDELFWHVHRSFYHWSLLAEFSSFEIFFVKLNMIFHVKGLDLSCFIHFKGWGLGHIVAICRGHSKAIFHLSKDEGHPMFFYRCCP